eukprot:256564-Rhodomonas_salina.1
MSCPAHVAASRRSPTADSRSLALFVLEISTVVLEISTVVLEISTTRFYDRIVLWHWMVVLWSWRLVPCAAPYTALYDMAASTPTADSRSLALFCTGGGTPVQYRQYCTVSGYPQLRTGASICCYA